MIGQKCSDKVRIAGCHCLAGEVLHGHPWRAGKAERRKAKVQRLNLTCGRIRVEQEVPSGNADIESALADIGGDVSRAQKVKLDTVFLIGDTERTGVWPTGVSGFDQHVDGGVTEGSFIRNSHPQGCCTHSARYTSSRLRPFATIST